jgi:hypothetical protein
MSGRVEDQFIRPTVVGDSVLPSRLRTPQQATVPWDGTDVALRISERLDPTHEAWGHFRRFCGPAARPLPGTDPHLCVGQHAREFGETATAA